MNLFWPAAFHWLKMLAVAEHEQLPVDRVRIGDAVAWDRLFQRYQLPLYVYVFELLHEEQASLDVVQETFIAAAKYIASLREDEKFGSWLFGIAHQRCVQRWRKRKREDLALEKFAAEAAESIADPAEDLIRREDEEHFLEAIHTLPEPQRAVLLLHYLQDFSLEDIADITDSQLGTVKSRLHYARKRLKKILAEGT